MYKLKLILSIILLTVSFYSVDIIKWKHGQIYSFWTNDNQFLGYIKYRPDISGDMYIIYNPDGKYVGVMHSDTIPKQVLLHERDDE